MHGDMYKTSVICFLTNIGLVIRHLIFTSDITAEFNVNFQAYELFDTYRNLLCPDFLKQSSVG